MATETVPARMSEPAAGINIANARFDMAVAALSEISVIARVLGRHIAAHNSAGEVEPLARGILPRIEDLAGAILECLGYCNDLDDAAIAAVVRMPPS